MLVGALNKCRTQPGSWQGLDDGAELYLRSVNKVMTQHGSEPELRCELRSVCRGLEQRQGPARSDQDSGCGVKAFAGMQQGQLPKCFSARVQMLVNT